MNSDLSVALTNFAKDLYDKDTDKIITEEEVKAYVASIKNDDDFISLNISAAEAENELKNMLDVVDDDAVEKAATDDTDATATTETTDTAGDSGSLAEEYNGIKARITELQGLIGEYDSQLTSLNTTLEDLQSQLEKEQKKYDDLVSQTQKEQDKYTSTQDKIESQNKEYSSLVGDIESTSDNLVNDIQNKQNSLVEEAKSKYDPQKDGSWEDFVQKYISDNNVSSSYQGQLDSLVGNSKNLSSSMNSLGSTLSKTASNIDSLSSQINSQANKVTSLNDQINSTINSINDITALKDAAQLELNDKQTELANFVYKLVSEEEYALVEKNNINLQEQMEDGSPRYIFARGKQDGAYHIYDLKDSEGQSLARLYGCKGDNFNGTDIVPVGNGKIKDYKTLDSNSTDGEEIFYFSCDGTMQNGRACYDTCSPLSFDINGDGVKTSKKVVNYDIDGDGKVDKINDSADAVLVFDKDGDGISGADGSECFGNNTDLDGDGKADGYKDGFEALKALAKKEGLINGKDDNKLDENDLKILEEKYGLKIKTNGYNSNAQSLSDVGITEINLSTDNSTKLIDNFDNQGNQLMTQSGATFKINGETKEYADIWHKKIQDSSSANSSNVDYSTTSSERLANSAISLDKSVLNFDNSTSSILNKIANNQKDFSKSSKSSKFDFNSLNNADKNFKKEVDEVKDEAQEPEKIEEDEIKKKKLNPFG